VDVNQWWTLAENNCLLFYRYGQSIICISHIKLMSNKPIYVRFQVLTATSIKMAVFWDVAPCSLVDIDRGVYCLHLQGHEHPDDGGSKLL
jgi:hypothetical protein